jgi:hypothetical protein
MRLPAFLKSLIGCTDAESSRYSLGAVYVERSKAAVSLTATDGRKLVNVSYRDEGSEPADPVLIQGQSLSKAFGLAHKKTKGAKPTKLDVINGKAMLFGPGGEAIASLAEGRFPRYRDVFSRDGIEDTRVNLNPERMIETLKVFADAGINSVGFYIAGPGDGVMLAGYAPTGEVVRAVVMPMAADEAPKKGEKPAPFPAEFDPAASKEKLPEPPAAKPSLGAAKERLRAAAAAAV